LTRANSEATKKPVPTVRTRPAATINHSNHMIRSHQRSYTSQGQRSGRQRQIITMVRCSLANATKLSDSMSRPHFHEPAPETHRPYGLRPVATQRSPTDPWCRRHPYVSTWRTTTAEPSASRSTYGIVTPNDGDGLEPWTATTRCGTSRAVRHWDRAGARDQKPAAGSRQAAADGANVRRRASSGQVERPGGGRFLTATLDA
jgi:hypothetical protein